METRDRNGTGYVGPGEGRAVRMPEAQLLTRKVSSEQSGGAFSLFEVAVRAGGSQSPHVQHWEDECFYVLEGRFEFLIEDARIEVGAGDLIYAPKGTMHAFENTAGTDGKLLVIQTPGGLYERFVEELGEAAGEPATQEAPDAGTLAAIGVEYGVEAVSPLHARHRTARDG